MKALKDAAAAEFAARWTWGRRRPSLRGMAGFSPRFADPEIERAFLSAERGERGQAIRALIVIAIVTLLGYIVINPMHFPPEGVAPICGRRAALIL